MTKAHFIALTLAIGLALPIWAQETAAPTEPAPAAEAAPAEATTTTAPSRPKGIAESADQAELGQAYWGPTHGDWRSRCFKTPDGSDPCEAFQILTDGALTSEGQLNQVAEISLFNLPEGSGEAVLGAVVIAPLETALQAGLAIKVDGGEPKLYPYSFCTLTGCVARIGLTAADVAEIKKGNEARVLIVPAAAPDQQVDIRLSLKGVTAAIDALPKIVAQVKQ